MDIQAKIKQEEMSLDRLRKAQEYKRTQQVKQAKAGPLTAATLQRLEQERLSAARGDDLLARAIAQKQETLARMYLTFNADTKRALDQSRARLAAEKARAFQVWLASGDDVKDFEKTWFEIRKNELAKKSPPVRF